MSIPRSKSMSKGGANIDRVLHIVKEHTDPQRLQSILRSRSSKVLQAAAHKKQPVQIQGFDKVVSRKRPSSFQMHKTRDANTQIDYTNCKDKVLSSAPKYSLNKETDARMSHLFGKPKPWDEQEVPEYYQTLKKNNEHIQTAGDLHNGRKTFHSWNFTKQTSRPFDQKLRKMSIDVENKTITRGNSLGSLGQKSVKEENPLNKMHRTHSFASYTKREFLTERKVRGAPEQSGIQAFKVNPQKFKGGWKVVDPPKFEQVARKHLNRYDRDCPNWYTKLAYNPKDSQKPKSHLDFENQTYRKMNLVQSSYPIRLAI